MSSLFLLPRNRDRIFRAIVNTEPANLIGYWPLDETSGTVARDYSGRGNNGAHVGVTLGYPGMGDGRTSTFYDGSTDYTNIYSAALAAAFNGAEGTLLVWAKVANAGVWTDGAVRTLLRITTDADNFYGIRKDSANNTINFQGRAGGGYSAFDAAGQSFAPFTPLVYVRSYAGNYARGYIGGTLVGNTTATGVWAGAPTTIIIGAETVTPIRVHSGTLAHVALWSKALTLAQIANVSVV